MTSDAALSPPTALSWAGVEALAAQYGASFYLADVTRFEDNYRHFLEAFQGIYPRTRIGYSYKTNYLPAFIRRAHALGAYSEVVSAFEFDYARRLGVPGERVIFNGPIKGGDELTDALDSGAVVNADSTSEVRAMVRAAEGLGGLFSVGLRCYLGDHAPDSRFGIDLTTGEGQQALGEVDAASNLRLAGLHCHQSGDRSAEHYRLRTKAMTGLHATVLKGRPLDFIDMGGGFGGKVSPAIAAQLASRPASFEEYAEAVAGEMHGAYGDDGPELILEPGMALLADTMTFVTRVEVVKPRRRLAVVDGSVFYAKPLWNILRGNHNPPIRVLSPSRATASLAGLWDVVGHSGVEADVVHRGYKGALRVGDYVVVENAGAYTTVLNVPFVRGTPPIVGLGTKGQASLLRPQQTARDLARGYEVAGAPDR